MEKLLLKVCLCVAATIMVSLAKDSTYQESATETSGNFKVITTTTFVGVKPSGRPVHTEVRVMPTLSTLKSHPKILTNLGGLVYGSSVADVLPPASNQSSTSQQVSLKTERGFQITTITTVAKPSGAVLHTEVRVIPTASLLASHPKIIENMHRLKKSN